MEIDGNFGSPGVIGIGALTGIVAGPGLSETTAAGIATISLQTPVTVGHGGTGAVTAPLALDSLSGAAGVTTGVLQRSSAGVWTVGAVTATLPPITLSGDVSGTGTTAIATNLANVNANIGTFQGLTVNSKGLVTAATNQSYATAPVSIAQGGTGAQTAPAALVALGAAPIVSPAFTGNPTGPTPSTADNSPSLSTTAFVKAQNYTTGGPYLPSAGGTVTGQLTVGSPAAQPSPAAGDINCLRLFANGSPVAGIGTITSITAGAGLTGGTITSTGTIALATPVTIANGGTGAASSAAALASLGALPLAGGTMTGPLAMGANNITGTGTVSATTFTGALTGHASLDLPLTGGTLSGALTVNGQISSQGAAGCLTFRDRATGDPWTWFSTNSDTAYLNYNGTNNFLTIDNTGSLTVSSATVSNNLVVNSNIYTTDQVTPAHYFQLYSNADIFYISSSQHGGYFIACSQPQNYTYINSNLQILGANTLMMNGVSLAQNDAINAGYNKIFDNSNATSLILGGSGTTYNNYYQQTYHTFRDRTGANQFAIQNGGITCYTSIFPSANNAFANGAAGSAWTNVQAYAFTNSSDPSLKTDIKAPPPGALAQVLAISPVDFRWKEDEPGSPLHRGFLAPDVAAAMGPDFAGAPRDEETGLYGLRYHELTCVLWQAVQELTARVRELEATAAAPGRH